MDRNQKSKGFTLAEMLVAIAIIGILCTVVIVNYNSRKKVDALNLGAEQLAGAIREAQNMAMSGNLFNGSVPKGYGIYINIKDPKIYKLFADINGDHEYSENEKVREYDLPPGNTEIKRIHFSSVYSDNKVSVVFDPPEPKITIKSPYGDQDNCEIILGLDSELTKAIKVNALSGQIDIE